MQQVFAYIQQHGNNPEQALNALAKEKGVDPAEALNNARNFMNGFK